MSGDLSRLRDGWLAEGSCGQ